MGEFEDRLNSILSSPEDMEKILGLARELSGSVGKANERQKEKPSSSSSGSTNSAGIDPKLIALFSRIMGEYSSANNDKTALISSIKPYVKEERRNVLDKAVKIARLTHVAKLALSEFSGGDFDIGL